MPDAQTITGYLEDDHRRIHALVTRAAGSVPFDGAAYDALRAALLRHIAIEEKVLFPVVFRAGAEEALPWAHDLRMDHAALTSLLVPTPDAALCREIAQLLDAHDQKEEGAAGVYAACEARLDRAQSVQLAAQAADYPAIRVAKHFDGHGTVRTAREALESAQRLRRTKRA